jgi:HEAT repeat protein/beta-lactamase regulating signal transducer with metallopeptidase domain
MSLAEFVSSGSTAAWLPALDIMLKATLVLVVAALITLALSRASAAVRHMVWTLAVVSALLLPALSIALPRSPRARPAASSASAPPASAASAPFARPETAAAPREPLSLAAWLTLIWAAGALAVVARLLIGIAAVQWMSRRTARVIDAPWLPLAIELAGRLGVSRRIVFAESPSATMPMAVGIFRPSVLMPADAVRWPTERLRIVLLHELAHVKRRDCLTHALAQLACAVHWFNPLVWVAARHIRTERERACDDLVLASGTKGPDYAEELLEIARVMRSGRFPALTTGATLAMAHRSQLEGRLMAILDPKVPRSGLSAVRAGLAAAAAAGALLPFASLQPWTVAQAAETSPSALAANTTPAPAAPASGVEPQLPTPMPTPTPTPSPSPRAPQDRHGRADEIARAAADAATQGVVQGAIQGVAATQATIQIGVDGAVGQSIQAAVQGAVAGAIDGAAEFAGTGQEGRRAADPRMVAALTAALKDSDKEVRETAMHALIQLRDPSVFEPLVQALKDASPDVREQAAQGLGQMRDKRAVEPLIATLKDPNPSVREAAAAGLSQLRDPRAVDPLIAALKDENAEVREHAVHALSQLRDRRATTAIAGLIKDANPEVRQQAVFALGQLRDPSAIEGLTGALRDDNAEVREQAAFALGQIRDPRAVSPLISALKDTNAEVREQAAFALGQLRDKAAVEALIVAVKDPTASVRENVVFALGQLRDPRAIDALMIALKDTSKDVRQKAAFALGQISR